jgi:thioredoxin 1
MSDKIVHITDESFEDDVLKAEQPVLVDYWAEWCGPCKVIAPILGEIAEEYAGKLQVAKLNIDENPSTPPKYGIRGIPTLMLVAAVGLSRQQPLNHGAGPIDGAPAS